MPVTPDPNLPKISAADKLEATTPIGPDHKTMNVPTQAFASMMQEGTTTPMANAGKAPMISPFDLAHGQPPLAQAPTLETLLAQVNGAQSTMGDMANQLSYPNLKLKSSQKYLLKNKLTDANASFR